MKTEKNTSISKFISPHPYAVECEFIGKLTGAFHALMDDPVQEGAAVITESRRGIGVQLEVVTSSAVLQKKIKKPLIQYKF